jgi:hypothetical protein
MNIGFFIIFLVLLITIIYELINKNKDIESFVDKSATIGQYSRPYCHLYTNKGDKLNIILISKPFGGDDEYKTYEENKDNFIFIGISSYLEFPNKVSNPFEDFTDNYKKYKYKEICKAWLHGFRNPEDYFPSNVPRLLLSESDFCDCNINVPDPKIEKIYDFVYICLKQDEKNKTCDDWATYNKNWKLAKKCLKIMCSKYKLKGALIGRKDCSPDDSCEGLMTYTNILSNDELKDYYKKSKFIFLPNIADASPRVITEAMTFNLPCLVNRNILGGWKYVTNQTGEFFDDENNLSQALDKLLPNIKNNVYNPRQYFIDNYGIIKTGQKLKNFLYSHFGNDINVPENEVDYITPDFQKNDYKKCSI